MKGLFEFLAKLTEWLFFERKRKAVKDDDPINKTEKWREAVHNEIANNDEVAANARLSDALHRRRMQKHTDHPSRPGDQTGENG